MNENNKNIETLRCKACNNILKNFEDKGFCYDCYITYESFIFPDIETEIEGILNDIS